MPNPNEYIVGLWDRRKLIQKRVPNPRRALPHIERAGNWVKSMASRAFHKGNAIAKIPAALPAIIFSAAFTATLFLTPPFARLPEAEASGSLLGNLLTAQAAIAALTLAVSLFVMQGTRTREDINDRLYREYLRRSWVTHIFWNSLLAVLITGVILLAESIMGESDPTAGLRNLTLIAILSFVSNLLLSGTLFAKAIHLSHPQQWRNLIQSLYKSDVATATRIFVARQERAVSSLAANEPDLTTTLPDPGEGSADEAVQGLLDAARRAMAERRRDALKESFDSIKELVEHAMDELEQREYVWGDPQAQPNWPPLRELGRNMYAFREHVIRQGDRDYLFELLRFNTWLISTGIERRCGELFKVGLDGYQHNYQISSRAGSPELHDIIRRGPWTIARGLTHNVEPRQAFPYLQEMIRHHERILSDAMQSSRPDDFDSMDKGFGNFFRFLRWQWGLDTNPTPEPASLYAALDREHRIVLMGLAARAATLENIGRISDMSPYALPARRAFSNPGTLADDLAYAIQSRERSTSFSQWTEWDRQDSGQETGLISVSPEKYPFTFFAIRMMEIVTDPKPTINLHGESQRTLDWFTNNSERLERHVAEGPGITIQRRRELVVETLEEAVINDSIQEDLNIIGWNLSEERMSDFTSEVYSEEAGTNVIERLFEQEESLLYLAGDNGDSPEARGIHSLVLKAFLAEIPQETRHGYTRLEGNRYGADLSYDVIHLLRESLEGASEIETRLDTPEDFVRAIGTAKEELNPSGEIIILQTGDWFDIHSALYRELPQGYKPWWQQEEGERVGGIARYLGHPIIEGPRDGERRLYVVEPSTWGCLIRAQFENGEDLRVEVNPVTPQRAQELMDRNPAYFQDEPNRDSQMRKLQTCAEVIIEARTQFHVSDSSRARRISNKTGATSMSDTTPIPTWEDMTQERTSVGTPAVKKPDNVAPEQV